MLTPRKVKYRKLHRPQNRGGTCRKTEISFGAYALKAQENGWVSARQIEAARRAMMRYIQRGGKIWIRIFPDRAITFKGNEIRMGGGKGAVDHYIAEVRKGNIIFEMDGITAEQAKEAMRLAAYKLSVKTKFLCK